MSENISGNDGLWFGTCLQQVFFFFFNLCVYNFVPFRSICSTIAQNKKIKIKKLTTKPVLFYLWAFSQLSKEKRGKKKNPGNNQVICSGNIMLFYWLIFWLDNRKESGTQKRWWWGNMQEIVCQATGMGFWVIQYFSIYFIHITLPR